MWSVENMKREKGALKSYSSHPHASSIPLPPDIVLLNQAFKLFPLRSSTGFYCFDF